MSQQINLFNPAFQPQRRVFSSVAMARALALLLVGVVLLALYAERQVAALQAEASAGAAALAQQEARLVRVNAQFAPRTSSPALAAELGAAEARAAAMREVAVVLARGDLGNTDGYAEYFKAFARQHMDGLWLTGVSISGAGNEVGVRGRALDPALVPAYLGRLTREPVLQGKAFGSLQIDRGPAATGKDAASFVEFSLQSTHAGAVP